MNSSNNKKLKYEDHSQEICDRKLIEEGNEHLRLSYAFEYIGEYLVEASIAAYQATAKSYEKTDWQSIYYYAYLLPEKIKPGPMDVLNRIIAESMDLGPEKALDSIRNSGTEDVIGDQYLYYATMADLYKKTEIGRRLQIFTGRPVKERQTLQKKRTLKKIIGNYN